MVPQKLIYLTFLFTALLGGVSPLSAQNEGKSEGDVLYFEPTSEKYNAYALQSYQGLPRFGVLNNYRPSSPGASTGVRPSRTVRDPVAHKKMQVVHNGQKLFYQLLTLKYMAPIYEDLDPHRITKPAHTNTEIQNRSYTGQRYLQEIIRTVGTPNLILKYFCNPDHPQAQQCESLEASSKGIGFDWGGAGANEFTQLRKYKAFVQEELKPLQAWAATVFPNDGMDMYYVGQIHLGAYDFQKQGYSIAIHFVMGGGGASKMAFLRNLKPQSDYENKLANFLASQRPGQKYIQTFLKMSPAQAEQLTERGIRSLYAVKKVLVQFNEVQAAGNKPHLLFDYHHLSPEIDLFEDVALTKNQGTISLKSLPFNEKP